MFPKIERPGIAVLLKYGIPRKTYSEEVYIFFNICYEIQSN